MGGTAGLTQTAVQALFTVPEDLSVHHLGFRVGTPFTAQGTAFEKNDCADTGTVMDTEFLNIEDCCFHLKLSLLIENSTFVFYLFFDDMEITLYLCCYYSTLKNKSK